MRNARKSTSWTDYMVTSVDVIVSRSESVLIKINSCLANTFLLEAPKLSFNHLFQPNVLPHMLI